MDRSTSRLLGALTGSVAIIAVAVVMLRGGESGRSSDARGTSRAARGADGTMAMGSELGVRAMDYDPARGAALEPVVALDSDVVASGAPQPRVEVPAPLAVEPPPQAPLVPDAAAVAAGEAFAAAMPAVRQQVQAAIARQKPALRKACWKGEVPEAASFPVEASFDAEGQLLALSIGDDHRAAGISPCVRDQPLTLDIDAPGVPITVQATIDLP